MDYCVDSQVSQFLFFWPGVMEMLNSCPVPLLASWVLTDLELNEHHILLQLVQLCEQLLSHQQSSYVTVNVADVCHRYTNKLSNILRSSEGGCVFQIHFPGQVFQVSLTSKKGIFFFLPSSDQHFDIHHPVWSEVRGRRCEPYCPAKPLCRYCRWLPCAPRWCFVLKHLCRKAAIVWPCPHPRGRCARGLAHTLPSLSVSRDVFPFSSSLLMPSLPQGLRLQHAGTSPCQPNCIFFVAMI